MGRRAPIRARHDLGVTLSFTCIFPGALIRAGRNDMTYNPIWGTMERLSLQKVMQIFSPAIGTSMPATAWLQVIMTDLAHLLGSRGFGGWNLWKPRLRSYEMLSHAGFSLLLSRRPVRAKCPWGNLILEISDIKSAPVHRGHWNSHVTKFRFFARRRRCGHQSAIFARSLRLHHKLQLAPF